MPDVPHQGVDQHQRAIKHVEERFVVRQVAIIAFPDLDDTIDVADQDQGAAHVQQSDDPLQFLVEHLGFDAARMEYHL